MTESGLVTALCISMVTMAVPLLFAALGELIAEKAGIINVGQEGILLGTAFVAMATAHFSGSSVLGVCAAAAVGVLIGALLALFVVALGADQVVSGTALNLLAIGATGVAYRALFGVTGAALTLPAMPTVPLPLLAGVPVLGAALFSQTVLGYLAFALVAPTAWALRATTWGLRLRMVGENPHAAAIEGVPVRRIRTIALILCGLLASLGGAFLSLAYARTFVEGMSAGRGFIALAIVIVGRWHPVGALIAALLFGLASAVQFHFQALGVEVPHQFFLMLPYVLTLVVLALFSGGSRAPAALGQADQSS